MRTEVLVDLAENKSVTVYSEDDVEPLLERNKELRAMPQKSDWAKQVADIPCIILVQWLEDAWKHGNKHLTLFSPEFYELVARKLRDPDYAFLRTDK